MTATRELCTFAELTSEIEDLLDRFDGEGTAKELFWSVLSYVPERAHLPLAGLAREVAEALAEVRLFASHGEIVVVYVRAAMRLDRMTLERLCRRLQRDYPWLLVLLSEGDRASWRLIFPDDRSKSYLRALGLPGDSAERGEIALALAAMTAAEPDDGSPVARLEILHRLDAFFPGPMPRMWAEDTIGTYINVVRPRLRRIEEFMRDIRRYPLLTRRQERGQDLAGDESAPDGSRTAYHVWRLIVHNLRFVVWLAYRMPRRGMEFEDLVQEGCTGLIIAAERFDLSLGTRFTTYAYNWVLQRMRRALDDSCNLVRWPVHRVQDLLHATTQERTSPLSPGERPVARLSLGDRVVPDPWRADDDPCAVAATRDERRFIARALGTLKEREQRILSLRFGLSDGEECTLEEVACVFGVTRERVRQIEERALARLRKLLAKTPDYAEFAQSSDEESEQPEQPEDK